MPIMDSELLFGESQSIAGTAGTSTTSTNVVYIPQVNDHTGTAQNDRPFVSQKLNWNCVVEDEELLSVTAGSSTITFDLYAHTAETGVTTSGTKIATKVITATNASTHPDGTQLFSDPLPVEIVKPYLETDATISTQELSTGKVTQWIGNAIQQGGEHGAL